MAKTHRLFFKKFPKKVNSDTLFSFLAHYALGHNDLQRMIDKGPNGEKEGQAFTEFNKNFTTTNMAPPTDKDKGKFFGKYYNKIKDIRDTDTLKSSEQQEAIKKRTQQRLKQPAYVEKQLGEEELSTPQVSTARPTDDASIIQSKLEDAINLIQGPKAQTGYTKEEQAINKKASDIIRKGGTLTKEDKVILDKAKALTPRGRKEAAAKSKERVGALKTGGKELLDIAAQAYRGGAPQTERFGQPTESGLLGAYDDLINSIKPDRTRGQNVAAALAPYGTQAGTAIGGTLGTLLGGPVVGKTLGGAGGALAGLAAGKGLEAFGKPESEFSKLQELLSGTDAGYFQGGKRGLADLISGGEDKRSSLQRLPGSLKGGAGLLYDAFSPFGDFSSITRSLRNRKAPSRMEKFRKSVGKGVKGIGDFIGAPGRAQQLRNLLSTGEAGYNLGKQLGLWGGQQPGGGRLPGTGQNIAAQALPGVLEYLAPALQAQTERFRGGPVPPQVALAGVDQQLQGALGPQMARQNIRESQIRSKRQALNMQRQALNIDTQTQGALNQLQDVQQQQRFQGAVRRQGQSSQESTSRAITDAQRAAIEDIEMINNIQVQRPQPLERLPRQPGFGDALQAVAPMIQQGTAPYVQQSIQDAFNQPIRVNPVGRPSPNPTIDTTQYDLSVT